MLSVWPYCLYQFPVVYHTFQRLPDLPILPYLNAWSDEPLKQFVELRYYFLKNVIVKHQAFLVFAGKYLYSVDRSIEFYLCNVHTFLAEQFMAVTLFLKCNLIVLLTQIFITFVPKHCTYIV